MMFNVSPETQYKVAMHQIRERVQDAENRRLARAVRRSEQSEQISLFERSQNFVNDVRCKVSRITGQEQPEVCSVPAGA
jgi:hypothetical protein